MLLYCNHRTNGPVNAHPRSGCSYVGHVTKTIHKHIDHHFLMPTSIGTMVRTMVATSVVRFVL